MRILFLALICLSLNCYSQNKDSVTISDLKEEVKSVAETPSKEVELYKLLYENQKDYNNTLVGIVIGFVALVIGGQVWFNNRYNQTELDRLMEEQDKNLEAFKNESAIRNLTEFRETAKLIRESIDKETGDVKNNLEKQLDDLREMIIEHKIEVLCMRWTFQRIEIAKRIPY